MTPREFLQAYRQQFEKTPLMFGETLEGVEAVWHTIRDFEDFIEGKQPIREAYGIVAMKRKCGNWSLASKVGNECSDRNIAVQILMEWLDEVRDLENQMRKSDQFTPA